MSIQFTDIKEPFATKKLKLPKLNVLAADAQPYEVLAVQPTGDIELRDDFIGHANRDSAKKKFSAYLNLALQKDCDLVLAPEYSCPWDVLTKAIQGNKLPKLGKLWILGCESITQHDLEKITSSNSNVIWIHESILTSSHRFYDVLAYVLKTESVAGDVKDVVVLQFKTQAMADSTGFERDHLIAGKTIYLFRNQEDHIRLVSLVCSESLLFGDSQFEACQINQRPFLIFHPQLNDDPRHTDVRAYRSNLFAKAYSDRTEVVTLNWARGFKVGTRAPSRYGGSAIYLKSNKFDRTDDRLDENHHKGLYYSRWQVHRTDLCMLNFDEHIFQFRTQKVFLDGPAVLFNRSGPEMLSLWRWDEQSGSWCECASTDDGFKDLCDSYQQNNCDWCLENPFTSVDRERLLTLSAGKLEPSADWHTIVKLPSFVAEDDERSKRLTFVQEQHATSVDFRTEHMSRYIKLQNYINGNASNFPPPIHDLRGDCRLRPPAEDSDFRFNLVSKSGSGQGATALFVDLQPPPYVQELKDKFIAAWGRENTRRLVIWYEHQGTIKCEHPPLPQIFDDSEHPASIARSEGL